jgi:hypothetical protein
MQAAASSARGGQVPPEADKFRQRRDAQDSVPTQSGRTGPTTVDRETK